MSFSPRVLLSLVVLSLVSPVSQVRADEASARYRGRIEFSDAASDRVLHRNISVSLNPTGCAGHRVTFSELRWGNFLAGQTVQQVSTGDASVGFALDAGALPGPVRRSLHDSQGSRLVRCGLQSRWAAFPAEALTMELDCRSSGESVLRGAASLDLTGASRIESWSGIAEFSILGRFGSVKERRAFSLARFANDRVLVAIEGASRPFVGRVQRFENFRAEGSLTLPGLGEVPVELQGNVHPTVSSGMADLGFGVAVAGREEGGLPPFIGHYRVQACDTL